MADDNLNRLFGTWLPRVFFQSGVLSSRDPKAIAAMDPAIEAEIAILEAPSIATNRSCSQGTRWCEVYVRAEDLNGQARMAVPNQPGNSTRRDIRVYRA
jgi:hypothetical protein